jgi:hypothetical protein
MGLAFLLAARSFQCECGTSAILRACVGEFLGFWAELQAGCGQFSKSELRDCVKNDEKSESFQSGVVLPF